VNAPCYDLWVGAVNSPESPLTLISAVEQYTGTLNVTADIHTVGSGTYPGSAKDPISGLPLSIFDKTSACVAQYGVSWQNYESIWNSCTPVMVKCSPSSTPSNTCITDSSGQVNMLLPPGDYIVIGKYEPTSNAADDLYIGVSTGSIAAAQSTQKYLQVIKKADGKKIPAKYYQLTGSNLLIIEPEYVEWDGTAELYPFVFDSLGEWTVVVTVSPPEGFVSDYDSLMDYVSNALGSVQFTITDVGSKWVSTEVNYKVKHKGKVQNIKSKLGIKLSKDLAKKKGLSEYGEEDFRHGNK
jgi:hypothetical protein